uniref:Uncharacterized protein n=1 Tax=Anopheles atroparvus TaxID=41427 RepID=A0AAG5DGB2_ANOAO
MISHHLLAAVRSKIRAVICINKQPSIIASVILRRNITTSSLACRQAVVKREEHFLKKDNIPPGFNIIYRAPMEYYLSACNFITSFSFLALGSVSAFTYSKDFQHILAPFEMEYASLTANETDLLYFLGFFLLINVVIRVVINRYPLRIYRNDKEYLAIFEGQIPLITKTLQFQRGDVAAVPLGGVLPWQESRYKINDKHVLLLDEYFKTPSELNIMMMNDKSGEA